jgi:hypothetical protein
MRSHARILSITAVTLGSALVFGGPGRAAEPMQISGKDTCKATEQHVIPVEGDPDHVLIAEKGTCSTSATGQSAMFDGGQLTWADTVDFAKGAGTIHGYYVGKYKDGSTAFYSYGGQAQTTMVDGKPHVTFHNTFEELSGTGGLANAHLKGSGKGEMISPNEAVVEWEGTLTEGSKQ